MERGLNEVGGWLMRCVLIFHMLTGKQSLHHKVGKRHSGAPKLHRSERYSNLCISNANGSVAHLVLISSGLG